ncbi:MAG TPA: hypothetical protein VEA40_17760 [Ramlibacter sp.]|nr:hypothetical protein [Ramlibacter sp.]
MTRSTQTEDGTRPTQGQQPLDLLSRTTVDMARRTQELQRQAAHELRLATNPAELVAVQAALLMAGWQHSVQCTTDLTNAWFALGRAGALPPQQGPTAGH